MFASNASLNRHVVRHLLYQAMPFWFFPSHKELLEAWWVKFTTNLFRSAGWNMEGGADGEYINDPHQLDLPEFLVDPGLRLAIDIAHDTAALRGRVQDKIDELSLDLDADEVVEELLRRAGA